MADDAHRQPRGASELSLEQVFKRLEELRRRQETCEDAIHAVHGQAMENAGRLDADAELFARAEAAMRDAVRAQLLLHEAEQEDQAATASGEFAPVRRKRHLSLVLGGLAAALAALAGPAMADTVADAGVAHLHHATAARGHHHPDADPGATTRA